jgi:hypothetical protein
VAGDSVMLRVVRSASVSPTDGHRPASARHPTQRTDSADGYRPASDRHPPQRTASADGHRPLPGPLQRRWMPLHQKSSCHMHRNISLRCKYFTNSFHICRALASSLID